MTEWYDEQKKNILEYNNKLLDNKKFLNLKKNKIENLIIIILQNEQF